MKYRIIQVTAAQSGRKHLVAEYQRDGEGWETVRLSGLAYEFTLYEEAMTALKDVKEGKDPFRRKVGEGEL